jgi:hypothetical protein
MAPSPRISPLKLALVEEVEVDEEFELDSLLPSADIHLPSGATPSPADEFRQWQEQEVQYYSDVKAGKHDGSRCVLLSVSSLMP